MPLSAFLFLILSSVLMLGGCSDGSDSSREPNPYAADEMWLCKPGISPDLCLELDQTTTFVYSPTSQAVVERTPAADPEFDCFYLYPTVDLREEPGNTEDVSTALEENEYTLLRAVYNHAAPFTELCNVYVPLYRQMTAGTVNLEGGNRNTEYFDIAFNDVNDAFNQFLKETKSRPFVLMGHSQGSNLLMELLLQRLENNEKLRRRLMSALVIGSLGRLYRPEGRLIPDEFQNIPLCTHATQTGCIITYDAIVAGGYDEREAVSRPCVNPTLLGGTPGTLEWTLDWEGLGLGWPDSIETTWAAYVGLFTANCDPDGFLAIRATPGREDEVSFPIETLQILLGGTLHGAEYNYAMGDLLRILPTQLENMP